MSTILNRLSQAAKPLLSGAVGVLPTDTLYGLVCRAADHAAVKRLYKLKAREILGHPRREDSPWGVKPGTVIAASTEQLVQLGLRARYLKAVAHLWPNAISVVLPCGDELEYLHLGAHSLAVRVPKDKALMVLLNKTGPLLTSSANLPGQPPANTLIDAQKYFGGKSDFYVEGGNLSGRQPSTVIKILDDAVETIRQGAVKID